MIRINQIIAVFILAGIIITPMIMSSTVAAFETIEDKASSIITNVYGLDETKYVQETSNYKSDTPEDYGGKLREDIKYSLIEGDRTIEFEFRFVDKSLAFMNIYQQNDSLSSAHYSKQMPTNSLEATKVILERLQTSKTISNIQSLLDTLKSVTNIDFVNATIGNLKRIVTINTVITSATTTSTTTNFRFMQIENNAEETPKSVNIQFRDGNLVLVTNGWNFYELSSNPLIVSKEQAIKLAKEKAEEANISDSNYREDPIIAKLTYNTREPFKAYPFWFVELPLYYPNSTITSWQVGIWGDTGEIVYSHPTGVYGPSNFNPIASPTGSENNQSEENLFAAYIVMAITAILIVVISAIVLKKRK